MTSTVRRLAVGIAALALVGVACDSGGGGGGGSVEAFCALEDEFDDVTTPNADQLDALVDAAPGEIKDDVRAIADAVDEAGDDEERQVEVFSDPDLVAAGQRVTDFLAENCDGEDEGSDSTETSAPDESSEEEAGGDLEAFCGLMSSPDFSIDGIDELMASAPPEIQADLIVVVQAQAAEEAGVEAEETAELEAARANVGEFIDENC